MRIPLAGAWIIVEYDIDTDDHPVWEGEKYHRVNITKAYWDSREDDTVDLDAVINNGTLGEHLVDKIWEYIADMEKGNTQCPTQC